MIYYIAIKLQKDQGFSYGSIESDHPYNAVRDYVQNKSEDSPVFTTSVDQEYEPSQDKDYIFTNGIICSKDIKISTNPMPEFEILSDLEGALKRVRGIISETFENG